MKTFKQYVSEEYIDWDLVLSESTEEHHFESIHDDPDYKIREHNATIGGNKVSVRVSKQPYYNYNSQGRNPKIDGEEHSVSFYVNGEASKPPDTNKAIGKDILHHVGRVVHSYVKQYVKTKPGKHIMLAVAGDENENIENKKSRIYRSFYRKLAKHTGGKYKLAPSFNEHEIHYNNK